MNKVNQAKLFPLACLLALASCGSTPEPQPEPSEELLAEAPAAEAPVEPTPEEVAALESELARMAEALEVAAEEPVTEEQAVADEVAELYVDPGSAFPVEIVDGVPVQMALVVEAEPAEEPVAEEVAEDMEVASVDAPAAETEPTQESLEVAEEPVAVLEFAEGMEDVGEPAGEAEEAEEVAVEPVESVEVTEADLAAMAEAMPDMWFEDPGLELQEPQPEDALAAAPEEVEGALDVAEDLVAEMPSEEEAVELMDQLAAVEEGAGPEATAEEPSGSELALSEAAEGEGDEGVEQVADAGDLSPAEVEAAIAASIASAMEAAPADQEVPEGEAQDELAVAPEGEAQDELAALVEEDSAAPADEIEWHVAPEPELPVAVAMEPVAVNGADESSASEVPSEEEAASLAIEKIEEAPAATAVSTTASRPLSEVFAFTSDLDPSTRLVLGPLCLADPSGTLARTSLSFMDLSDLAAGLTASAPEDPALTGLVRSDGSEFDPVPIDEAELTDEPGLGMIWWGKEVPEAQVGSKVEVQTPSVGRVRLVLNSGDYVEGVLHSVGQSQYWVDGELGRFAVRAGLVSHVEHLPKPGLGQEVSGLQAGDLVRAKAKSGFIEGRLVSMKDGEALIETAEGMRITLPDAEVEPLGHSKTRVVID